MNFDYEILSDPNLSLDFIKENLDKFSKVDFNILSIFNKNITKEFREAYPLYDWAHYDHQTRLLELRSQFPVDYDAIKKENKKKLRDNFEKIEVNVSKENKHKHLKK
jgi:lipopolysaccharide assembly outer membrane protein LptD (OstA)